MKLSPGLKSRFNFCPLYQGASQEFTGQCLDYNPKSKLFLNPFVEVWDLKLVGKNNWYLLIQTIFQHNTIEAVLERGEKLDDLVDKSEALSLQSKAFYKTARKTNSCCGTSWG